MANVITQLTPNGTIVHIDKYPLYKDIDAVLSESTFNKDKIKMIIATGMVIKVEVKNEESYYELTDIGKEYFKGYYEQCKKTRNIFTHAEHSAKRYKRGGHLK